MLLLLCLVMGLIWGMLFVAGMNLAGIPMDWMDAVWSGLLFGVLVYLCLFVYGWRQNKRIRLAEARLPSPAQQRFSGMMRVGKRTVCMAVFLCETELCLVEIDQKDLPVTVYPAAELIRAVIPAARQLELHFTGERSVMLYSAHSEALLTALRDRGWLPFQH